MTVSSLLQVDHGIFPMYLDDNWSRSFAASHQSGISMHEVDDYRDATLKEWRHRISLII